MTFLEAFISVWPSGLWYLAAGAAATELAGELYHRVFLHGVLVRRDGKPYLFVPWKTAFEKHMWHHHVIYTEPGAPGREAKPFRQKRWYYKGAELAPHRFGREPSNDRAFDYAEWLLSRVGVPFSLDWLMAAALFGIVPFVVIGDVALFAWFFLGGFVAAWINHFTHDSFHVIPYRRLSDVPLGEWTKPAVAIANLMTHAPGLRAYYDRLLRIHVAHHYDIERIQASNAMYDGVRPNASLYNFSIYSPVYDVLLGTYSSKRFERMADAEND